ncbi:MULTISPECIES: alpha/beta hydrolase [Nocardia]|uniref:alpha/beta hydrolase n=1 Tax=Nocardia abscessus TaxID=120957 RepID=UPI0018952409|nr:alpha/beta hydrolase [Nocardia abscessus]MBF6475658.1 alpha/beta hydrolase [Nocardia abscessus]
MPLTPEAQVIVDAAAAAFPALGTEVLDAAEARRLLAARPASAAEPIPVAQARERRIPGPPGESEVRVRIYRPESAPRPAPVVMFCHGGGFVICGLDSHDRFCRAMAVGAGAIVVSVDYRQAPEHRFPAAAEDAYAALCWVADDAESLGGDPARLVVAGDSAGGNLAAVTALMARDRGGPKIARQLLLYPMLDPACATESYRANAEGYFTTAAHLRWYWSQYLGSHDGADPYANPLTADLSGLPPAYIVTAEFDPLRDEGEDYGLRLRNAGVEAEIHRYDGMFHGFMSMAGHLPESVRANTAAYSAIRVTHTRNEPASRTAREHP